MRAPGRLELRLGVGEIGAVAPVVITLRAAVDVARPYPLRPVMRCPAAELRGGLGFRGRTCPHDSADRAVSEAKSALGFCLQPELSAQSRNLFFSLAQLAFQPFNFSFGPEIILIIGYSAKDAHGCFTSPQTKSILGPRAFAPTGSYRRRSHRLSVSYG